MALLGEILLLPVTGPLRGLLFICQQIKEQVDAEQLDESVVENELLDLGLLRDLGQVSEEEYLPQEAALLQRLNAIRAYKASLMASQASSRDGSR